MIGTQTYVLITCNDAALILEGDFRCTATFVQLLLRFTMWRFFRRRGTLHSDIISIAFYWVLFVLEGVVPCGFVRATRAHENANKKVKK